MRVQQGVRVPLRVHAAVAGRPGFVSTSGRHLLTACLAAASTCLGPCPPPHVAAFPTTTNRKEDFAAPLAPRHVAVNGRSGCCHARRRRHRREERLLPSPEAPPSKGGATDCSCVRCYCLQREWLPTRARCRGFTSADTIGRGEEESERSQGRIRKREEGQMRQGGGCSGCCWRWGGVLNLLARSRSSRLVRCAPTPCAHPVAPRYGRVHLAEANFRVVCSYCLLTPQRLYTLGIGWALQTHYNSNFGYLCLGEEIEAWVPMQGV